MKGKTKSLISYIAVDWLASVLAWSLFFLYRKEKEGNFSWETVFSDPNFYLGILIIPICWILLYGLFEEYQDLYRKGRFVNLNRTFFHTLIGSVLIFFVLIMDDQVAQPKDHYQYGVVLFLLQFFIVGLFRTIELTTFKNQIKKGKVQFNTLIIGNNQHALDAYQDIVNQPYNLGYNFVGFVDLGENHKNGLQDHLPNLGDAEHLDDIISEHTVEDVIIASGEENKQLKKVVDKLFQNQDQIYIKIIPHIYDILLGQVKMNHLYDAVLIEIHQELMPQWQRIIKRMVDISVSGLVLFFLLPLYIYIAIRVKLSSPGPVFYRQERVGQGGKPFDIIKFRSMYENAEEDGPQLSSEDDPRVTKWGAIMRKYRLDELPQFWHVISGEMSLVGPRPERQYYIDQLLEIAPHYRHLFKVRPGITSWGMVKYGYASNLEEMIQRLKFDLLYIENRSLALDFKIIFYTVLVILKGDGK